ncbi:MAG: hypothetical protein Q4G64_04585, partial [bacterium]|nr:hypothetical protein [bacterium]
MATSKSSPKSSSSDSGAGFSDKEKAAMKQRAAELKEEKAKKSGRSKKDPLQDCLDAIAAMEPEDRAIAERLHEVITTAAPDLAPKTWYGFPSYAKDGKVLVFFQPAHKFDTRYGTQFTPIDNGSIYYTPNADSVLAAQLALDAADAAGESLYF